MRTKTSAPDFPSIRSLADLRHHLATDESALRLLEWLRWPEGPVCPACGGLDHWPLGARRPGLYECGGCGRQFSATSNTPMHGTKLPPATWIEAAFLFVASSKGMSSLTLARHLGITQRSAWRIGHAFRRMMEPPDDEPKLSGVVEVDDLADGGNPARRNRSKYGAKAAKHIHNPRGRGSRKKRIMIATERGGRVRTAPIKNGSASEVGPLMGSMVAKDAHLMTDGDRTLVAIGKTHRAHSSVVHSQGEYARGDAHVNTAEAFNLFLVRAKMGVWHSWSDEHVRRYLAELQFHWDHRPVPIDLGASANGTQQRRRFRAIPPIVVMRALFSRAEGRGVRRTRVSSVEDVDRSVRIPQ